VRRISVEPVPGSGDAADGQGHGLPGGPAARPGAPAADAPGFGPSSRPPASIDIASSGAEAAGAGVRGAVDHVLVVEDSALDARLVESFLRRTDAGPYEVTRARSLEEASSALLTEGFAAILLDLNLPDARGLEALEVVRKAAGGVPVVVLTGSDDKLGLAAVRAGAEDFLLKGRLSPALLGRVVRYAIERAEYRRRSSHAGRLIAAGRLAATVAHEVNNPAAFVVANQHTMKEVLEALRGSLGDRPDAIARLDEVLTLLADNIVGLERIQSIVKSLKGFTQPSRGAIGRVDLPEVVQETCRLVENQIRYLAKLELRFEEEVPPIAGDRTRLAQLITNLVTNAAHAIDHPAKEDDLVKVFVGAKGDEVLLRVEDTGRGIPEHLRDRIFEPFFTTRERSGGTGLGLALTAEIVRQHRGVIRHWDRSPRGTVMEVRLPKATGLVSDHDPGEAGSRRPAEDRRARVLLIDDEVHLLRALRRALQPHEVTTVPGGAEALALLAERRDFDLVLCDLMMPQVDGAAVHQYLQEQAPELLDRLVFVSGGAFTTKVQRFLAHVGRPVIDKPVDVPTLRRLAVSAVHRRLSLPASAPSG